MFEGNAHDHEAVAGCSLTFIDLFAGIGGFRMGFQNQGYECLFSCEIDKACQDVYYDNFSEKPFGDITRLNPDHIPDFDVLVAGFPCQPFSICGYRRGFDDTRGTLFFDICRIIDHKYPDVVLLENVKYLIYHDHGRTLSTIVRSLNDFGYKVSYEILNAKNFGLPQHRERLFIVCLKDRYFNFSALRTKPTPKLRDFLDKEGHFEALPEEDYTLIGQPVEQKSGLIFVGYRNKNPFKKGIRPNSQHLSRVHHQPNRIYSVNGVHPTLPSQETSGRFFIYFPETSTVRKLTISECYRIMGFPRSFKPCPVNGKSYLQIGNSVCVPQVEEVARAIKTQLGDRDESQREAPSALQPFLLH